MANSGYGIDDLQVKIGIDASGAATGLKDLAKGLRDMASDASRTSQMMKNLSKAAQDMGVSTSESGTEVEKGTKNIEKGWARLNKMYEFMHKATSALKGSALGKVIGNISSSFSGLLSTFTRVGTLRLMRMAIMAIINAMKEGLNMFVEWDRKSNGSMAGAANAMDRLKEATSGLKAQFGALLGGILTQLEPAFNWLITQLTHLIDMFQMLSRVLQGHGTYYKYVAGSAKEASGAAKELKKVLFGFDELNILPSQNGGGGSTGAIGGRYELEDINGWVARAAKEIGDAYSDKPLMRLILFGAKGAQYLFEWIGENVSKPIVNWFRGTAIPWVKNAAKSVWDAIGNFFSETIPQALTNVGSWISNTAQNAWNGVVNIWGKLKEWVSNLFTNAWNGATEIWSNFTNWVSGIASNAWGKVVEIWGNFKGWLNDKIATPITSLWTKIKENVFAPIAKAWEDVKRGAVDAWEGVKKPFVKAKEWFSDTFGEAWRKVKGIFSGDSDVIQGIKDGLSNAFKTVINKLISGLNSVIARPFNALNSILKKIKDVEIFSWKPFQNIVASVSVPQIPYLAEGGLVPNTGTLFAAGEAGAEVVANLGHSTGVMNVSQMQDAVANGNIEVVNAVYAMANMVASAINNKKLDVYMDTQKVGQSVSKYQFNQARRGITQGGY